MDPRDLAYFVVVAEHGNVTRASEALGLTPTALSKSLRRLEADLGARIVVRSPRGVRPTAVGEVLLTRARGVGLMFDEIRREAADLGGGRAGHLRIGAGPLVCDDLSRVYTALQKETREVTMEVTVGDNDQLLPMLRAGELDLIYNYRSPISVEGVTSDNLHEDTLVACAARNHPLAKRRRLALDDLVGERWALSASNLTPSKMLCEAFLKRGLPAPRIAVRARSLPLRLRLWATSDLLGLVARHTIREYASLYPVVELPVKDLQLRRQFAVAYRKDGYLSPVRYSKQCRTPSAWMLGH